MSQWPLQPLGSLLTQTDRFEPKDELTEYRFAGTYSFARGVFVGDTKLGSSFRLPKIQRVRSGDFVYCKIMAWEGAFGVAPPEVDGCVLSGAFVVYEIDRTRLDPAFIDYYFKLSHVWKGIGSQSTGTNVRRRSLHPDQFERAEIPLPPIEEQRRIVGKIERLAGKVEEAKILRREAGDLTRAFRLSLVIGHPDTPNPYVRVGDYVQQVMNGDEVSPERVYQFAGVKSFGEGVFQGPVKSGAEFSYRRVVRVQYRDFVYPKLMAWEGAFGMVPADLGGYVVSPEFPVFRTDESRLLPEVLDTYFRSPTCLPAVRAASTGTNVRRRRLHPKAFLNLQVPLPSMSTQNSLRVLYQREAVVGQAAHVQSRIFDALLPSILDKAFKGEL